MSTTASADRPGQSDLAGEDRRLRVLVVTVSAAGMGGMQRHTHDLVRGLVGAGHDVEVVCPSAEGLERELYGACWTLLETTGRYDPRWSTEVLAAYRAAQARSPLDIVHSESTSAAPLVRARLETPIVVAYHGNYLGLAKAHVTRAAARPLTALHEAGELSRLTWLYLRDRNAWAFRRCEAIVVSRQQLRDSARSSLAPLERFHVVPIGVDVSLFRPGDQAAARRALGIGDGVVLTTIGRLNREKGFDVALEALSRLAPDHPDVRLVVVGDGEERAALEELARSLGVEKQTQFVGAQPHELVAQHLVASDIFLFPTRRDEAGPLVLPQAMACGLPVIASRIGGVTEVLEPEGAEPVGVLVRPGRVSDLAAGLLGLLDEPARRASLGAAARNRAVSEYSIETMVQRTVAAYRSAIARDRERLS